MKAQRLLAITMLLLGRDSVSAPELAKRFEVSVRTIYRDIEALCEAGVPVVAYPGAGGGYGIMGGFRIDRSIIRPEEIGPLTSALCSLSSAIGDDGMSQAADRLKALAPRRGSRGSGLRDRSPRPPAKKPENYLFMELAPAARERKKITVLRRGIEESRVAAFSYVDAEGRKSRRRVEPYALVFTWQSWFLYAFCLERGDFRLFKIARLKDLSLAAEGFEPREVDLDARPWNRAWEGDSPFRPARIAFPDAARIEEHFPEEDIERREDGGAVVTSYLPADEWAVTFLLGLGQAFEVLEPEDLKKLVDRRAREIAELNSRP